MSYSPFGRSGDAVSAVTLSLDLNSLSRGADAAR